MDDFVSRTKQFYKSFLDGLYNIADLLLENRPQPKPPDIDKIIECKPFVSLAISSGQFLAKNLFFGVGITWTKKRSFDLFVKRRRKKL